MTLVRTLLLGAGLVLAGCASTKLDAQWLDAQHAPLRLQGARVVVACEAVDTTLRQLCQDELAAEVTARGATAVPVPVPADVPPGAQAPVERYLAAARERGAQAVLATTVTLADRQISPGVSIGFGGFGIGSGRVQGGVGVSVPVGGGDVRSSYAADARLTDVASGKLVWSARATAPASQDTSAQMASLARTLVSAADKAGAF
jgi:hypothetical protein